MKAGPIFALITAGLTVFLAGCSHDFDPNAAKPLAEMNAVQLDSEQVALTEAELSCGVTEDLWEETSPDGSRAIYRLTQKARDLNFSEDIYARDPEYPTTPYTQLRGKFNLNLDALIVVNDGPEDGTKLVQATYGVKIPHLCFPAPLMIMGVNKGKFSTRIAPTLQYENSDKGWQAVKFVH
jgi:hypothetical protein